MSEKKYYTFCETPEEHKYDSVYETYKEFYTYILSNIDVYSDASYSKCNLVDFDEPENIHCPGCMSNNINFSANSIGYTGYILCKHKKYFIFKQYEQLRVKIYDTLRFSCQKCNRV